LHDSCINTNTIKNNKWSAVNNFFMLRMFKIIDKVII